MICPTCKWPIPAELIVAERNREIAARPRPSRVGVKRKPYKRKPKQKAGETK